MINKLSIIVCTAILLMSCAEKQGSTAVNDSAFAKANNSKLEEFQPKTPTASIITAPTQTDTINAWTVYHKTIDLDSRPRNAIASIAVDSKYWLWINGETVVRSGGLKRGPSPTDTYYDVVDVSQYLKEGPNAIAVLVNYFGKEGFSHKNSGLNGLMFQLDMPDKSIHSDNTWKAWPHPAFGETEAPHPNYRLPESNLHFDAQKGGFEFAESRFDSSNKPNAVVSDDKQKMAWGDLIQRPIPQWKDFGLREYQNPPQFHMTAKGDTIKLKLPYNLHAHPYFKVNAKAGQKIHILTDHYRGGGTTNMRAEHITREGKQEFELLGWINGEEVFYVIPKGIEILDLKYRETGYDTEFAGSFSSDNEFYDKLWQKARRTLYVTMRDTYMDCPDRERAQWWGDVVLESGESFYALDRKSDALMKKGMYELMNWQRQDSTIFSPVPAGNWNQELPGQMLASVGYYGFYNYYLHTGDIIPIADVYDRVKQYLAVYKLEENGTIELRKGGWFWGDWGQNKDMRLLLNTQYYIALKGLHEMAVALEKTEDALQIKQKMADFKKAFNDAYWTGNAYRSPDYEGKTDDRSQALAIVGDLADEDKYPAIINVLKEQRHASPYMEKYVCEALFIMDEPDFALTRLQERFDTMVNYPHTTTLWEGWGIGKEGYGGGTTNHAWSGGGLTLLSQYVAGIAPASAGYETFQVKPQMGFLKKVNATVPSIKGDIKVAIDATNGWEMEVTVPENSSAMVYIPSAFAKAKNNNAIMQTVKSEDGKWLKFAVNSGTHKITAE